MFLSVTHQGIKTRLVEIQVLTFTHTAGVIVVQRIWSWTRRHFINLLFARSFTTARPATKETGQLICLLNYLFQPTNLLVGSKTVHESLWCVRYHLYRGHTLRPLLSFLLTLDVARSTGSLRKSNSFSDSMHCFLNTITTLDINFLPPSPLLPF